MRTKAIFIFLLTTIIFSCTVEPEAINYGKDACQFCKMTIVDKQHAAEAVTSKGKVYKYDAGECLVNDLKQRAGIEMTFLLVNDYANPGKLVDANTAIFLISENIKSPMGANLSAFTDSNEARRILNQNGGELLNWEDVQQKIK